MSRSAQKSTTCVLIVDHRQCAVAVAPTPARSPPVWTHPALKSATGTPDIYKDHEMNGIQLAMSFNGATG